MHPLSSTYDENESISARNGTQPTRCRLRQQTAKPSKLRTPACKRSAPNRCSEWGFPCLQQYGQRFQGIIDWSPSGEHSPLSGAQPMQIASRTAAATHTLTDGHSDSTSFVKWLHCSSKSVSRNRTSGRRGTGNETKPKRPRRRGAPQSRRHAANDCKHSGHG